MGTRGILLVRALSSFVNYVERGDMVDGIVEVRIESCWLIFRNEHLHDSESGVVRISLNDTPIIAMLDSGAQPSIVDKGTLSSLKVSYACCSGTVHGVGATPVSTLARVQLDVAIGQICSLKHMFLVLDAEEPTIILGRNFLSLFSSTEFDWANHKIRVGKNWLRTDNFSTCLLEVT